jgi:outer membrane receptor protein involved in Fe transport
MNTMTPSRNRSALAFLLALGLQAPLLAQTAPAPAATPAPLDDKIIVLDTFTVDTRKDNGYVAVDSLAGGRNNTPVSLTPSSMSSLTETFLDDLQLTDVRSALKWTLSAVPVSYNGGHDGGGDVFNSWSYNIRGAGTGPQGGNPPTVNYFPFYGVKDLFNVDRVEIDRGPNSILFGVGNLGGTVSTYTKIPRFDHNTSDLDVRLDSFGGARVTADVNQVASVFSKNDLGLRVNLLADHDQGWRKDDLTKRYGASIATKLNISENSSLRVDVEGYQQQTPQFATNITDNYSLWDGKTNSATWGAAPTGGTSATNSMAEWGGPASTLIWIPSEGNLLNWGAGLRGTGPSDSYYAVMQPSSYMLGNTGLTVAGLPSRDFTVGPKDGTFDWKYYTATAYFDQKINSNAEFQLAAYHYADLGTAKNFESPGSANVDINKQLPNGQANPEYGQLYSDMFLDRQIQDHTATELRAQINYHFDTTLFNVPVKEWMSVSLGDEKHDLVTRQYIATSMNGYDPNNWTANMVWAREYWNHPNTSINLPASFNGSPLVYLPLPFNWFDHNLTEKIKYAGFVSQTRFWDDRLSLTLGVRHDKYDSSILNVRGTGNVPTLESDAGTTYSAGLVGYITKWFGLTYNYSENFAPIGGGVAPSLTGDTFGPATGKSNSFGLRIATDDHKYYVTATYYQDKAHGRISNDNIDLQGAWNNYLQAGGTAVDIGPAGVITGTAGNLHANMSYADTQDVKNTGYEFEAVANPTTNLRLQIGLSLPKSVADNDLPGSRAYFAAHLAEWQTQANANGNQYQKQLAQVITQSQTTLANTSIPASSAGTVKSTFNFFAVYTFTDSWAKGFAIGGGGTTLGKQNISTGGTAFSPGFTTLNALLSYSTVFNIAGERLQTKFQLNVDNLLDNKNLIYTGYNTFGSQTQGSGFNYLEPRKFTLSANFKF